MQQVVKGDCLVLVVRSTDARRELALLLETLDLVGRKLCVVFTFADKTEHYGASLLRYCEETLRVPAIHLDARGFDAPERSRIVRLIEHSGHYIQLITNPLPANGKPSK